MRAFFAGILVLAACGSNEPAPSPTQDGGPSDAADGSIVDTGTSTRSTDAGFPDAGPRPTDQCNPITQDCVDPSMSLCVVEPAMAGQGTTCVDPSTTALSLGQICRSRDCAPGLACVRTSSVPRCVAVCAPGSATDCARLGGDHDCRSIHDTNWGACVPLPPICDPYTQAPCAALEACQPVQRTGGAFDFRCRTAGPGAEGGACDNTMGCGRGLLCVRENGVTTCRKPCHEGGNECSGGTACTGTVLTIRYCR